MDELTNAANNLNFHHLRYFWLVARNGNLTRTAQELHVSQSALSSQIRQLEDHLGEPLFDRTGRRLTLTEAGRIALSFADAIFGEGGRMVATLRGGRHRSDVLRIGAMATLSRNFLDSFLRPLFARPELRVRLVSGSHEDLLDRLHQHTLDLVLGNRPVVPGHEVDRELRCARVAHQPVSLIGHPAERTLSFPEDLAEVPLLVPTTDSAIRTSFDSLCDELGVQPRIVAEVDDMALLRLLARDTHLVALLPAVVVRDELKTGALKHHCVVGGLEESFFATTLNRRFPHPLLGPLLDRTPEEILQMERADR